MMLEFAEWQLNKLLEKCKDEDSKIMQNVFSKVQEVSDNLLKISNDSVQA